MQLRCLSLSAYQSSDIIKILQQYSLTKHMHTIRLHCDLAAQYFITRVALSPPGNTFFMTKCQTDSCCL